MSAPRTNLEKQKRRHIGPLIGMAVVVLFGVVLMVYWLFEEAAESDVPPQDETIESAPADTPPETTEPVSPGDPGTVVTPGGTAPETPPAD